MAVKKTALQIFRIVAPEFNDIPDDDVVDDTGKVTQTGINTYIELYSDLISKKKFGSLYEKALAYLTAHKLKLQGYGDEEAAGKVGDALYVSSYSEGETSISYSGGVSTNTQVDAEYGYTKYGMEFLNLRRLVIIPIVNAGEGDAYVD